jgi:hypothetical protein
LGSAAPATRAAPARCRAKPCLCRVTASRTAGKVPRSGARSRWR